MRRGFTMIELVFVIVILGILASIAIPKLSATRTDAQVSRALTDVSTFISDLGAYFTSKGNFSTALADMTNVAGLSGSVPGEVILTIKGGGYDSDCISFDVNETGAIRVSNATSSAGNNSACGIVLSSTAYARLAGNHSFGGSNVNYE